MARVWTAIIDLPVPWGSAQAAHRHYTRPFPSWRKRSGYTRLQAPKVDRTSQKPSDKQRVQNRWRISGCATRQSGRMEEEGEGGGGGGEEGEGELSDIK